MNNEFSLDTRPLVGKLKDIRPLKVRLVNKTSWEQVWDYLVRNYHFPGCEVMIGPMIKHLVFHENRPIAALSYNLAVLRLGVRDTFLDWTPEQKHKILPHVVNNNLFLILPWVRVKNLSSHLLACALKLLGRDWPALYGTDPFLVETCVDRDKFRGIHSVNPVSEKEKWPFKSATAYLDADLFRRIFRQSFLKGKGRYSLEAICP